jgi:hypothetical protein
MVGAFIIAILLCRLRTSVWWGYAVVNDYRSSGYGPLDRSGPLAIGIMGQHIRFIQLAQGATCGGALGKHEVAAAFMPPFCEPAAP